MSYSPVSVETLDNPNEIRAGDDEFVTINIQDNNIELEEVKTKIDEVMNAVNEVEVSICSHMQDVEISLLESVREMMSKMNTQIVKVIRQEISAAMNPRRLVPAVRPRIPESVVDLRSSDDEDDPTPTPTFKKSKLDKYTEK